MSTKPAAAQTDFLNGDVSIAALRGYPMPDEPEARSIREFVFENDAVSDDAYAAYGCIYKRK